MLLIYRRVGLSVGQGGGSSASGARKDTNAQPTMLPDASSSATKQLHILLRRHLCMLALHAMGIQFSNVKSANLSIGLDSSKKR